MQARARIAKAQADTRTLASAISIYAAHMGVVPSTLALLTNTASNSQGQTAGPFMAALPNPPAGWTPSNATYVYAMGTPEGTFMISATGDNATASAP